MAMTPGTRLGPYEVLGAIGAGGMGEVFRARDPRLARDVAIKVLPEAFSVDADRRARFEREAQTVASLSHPNIVNVYDTGTESGRIFVVMELLEGEPLRASLTAGALPARKAIEIAIQIARGLAAAHDKGLVHRDLKPENVFLLPDGQVKILDFGLARGAAPSSSGATQTAALTDPGMVMGTVGYMAPEQVRGQSVDARTDLFALGTVLYEMLAGARAFQRDTAAETMTAILKEDPPEIGPGRSGISPALDRIVRHALEKNPVERFQTARDVAFALGALSGSATAAHAPIEPRMGRKARAIGAVVAAVALVAAGALAAGALAPGAPALKFSPKTFDSNIINAARFMPDGATIVYSARLPDGGSRLFEIREGAAAPKLIGPPNTILLSISSSGEYAVLTQAVRRGGFLPVGTLSRMTFGEEPRAILDGVSAADWSPDASSFAIVRRVDGLDRLEYPVGNELFQSAGYLSDVRVSPDGRRVLFMDHASINDDRGWVRIADGRTITTIAGELSTELGSAWTADGRAVLFSGSDLDQHHRIWLADAPAPGAAPPRKTNVVPVPGGMIVFDVSKNGTLLTTSDLRRYLVGAKLTSSPIEQDMSWLDMSWSPSLSADGSLLVFADGHGGAAYSTVLRRTSGSSISRLGAGAPIGLSPDGKHALAVELSSPPRLIAFPTGAGATLTLPSGGITQYEFAENIAWFPDGRTFVFRGAESDKRTRSYKQSLDGGPPVPLLADTVHVELISPDGLSAVGLDADETWRRYMLDGSGATEIRGLRAADFPVGWTNDRRGLIVATRGFPPQLDRVDLATGARRMLRQVRAPGLDSALLIIRDASADGEQFAYSGLRQERILYTVEGAAIR